MIAGDEAAAAAYLTEAAKARCSSSFERMAADNLRVTLVSTIERPASADVKVLITVSEGGGRSAARNTRWRMALTSSRRGTNG